MHCEGQVRVPLQDEAWDDVDTAGAKSYIVSDRLPSAHVSQHVCTIVQVCDLSQHEHREEVRNTSEDHDVPLSLRQLLGRHQDEDDREAGEHGNEDHFSHW